MDKATKYYKKALIKYHKGYIDEAIDLCGASVAENNKYKAAASLKGILFYFKGDLENARELWEFNFRINRDVVSKKYIDNTKLDDKFLSIYAKAVVLINEIKIADGLALLKECEQSDFNLINVSNHIALCFIKQGEFDKAKPYLDRVLSIDKKNKMAIDNINMLKQYGIIDNKFAYTPVIVFGVIILILGSGLSIYFAGSKKIVPKVQVVKPIEKSQENTEKVVKSETPKPAEKVKPIVPVEVFPYDNLKTYIDQEDYEKIDRVINSWKGKDIDLNSKILLEKSLELMKNKGLEALYIKGYKYSTDKDYKSAVDYYYKIYFYGNVNYIYESALFYLATSKEHLGSIDEALKYYEEYSNNFPKGSYEATVLYSLTSIYSTIDINKAKIFAKIISKDFPDSDYNNTYIKNLLSN